MWWESDFDFYSCFLDVRKLWVQFMMLVFICLDVIFSISLLVSIILQALLKSMTIPLLYFYLFFFMFEFQHFTGCRNRIEKKRLVHSSWNLPVVIFSNILAYNTNYCLLILCLTVTEKIYPGFSSGFLICEPMLIWCTR